MEDKQSSYRLRKVSLSFISVFPILTNYMIHGERDRERACWVGHVTQYFHSYFFRHDGAKRQYSLLCKYIIDLVRTAIKHERLPFRGRPSKVTPLRGSVRTADGVSNGLACAARLESLMRTCWLGCRDREREREGSYAFSGNRPVGVFAAALKHARRPPAAPRPVSRSLTITCRLARRNISG